jgi:uncharacterized membrane protein
MKYAKTTYSLILFGSASWCAAIVLVPICAASPGILRGAGLIGYAFFHSICHQMAERSFFIDGMPFGVCARCAAIYFGFFAGTLIYPFLRSVARPHLPPRLLLFIASVPVIVDAFPLRFGIYEATTASRAVTGSILGFTLAFFIVPAAILAVSELAGMRTLTIYQQKGISNATETR